VIGAARQPQVVVSTGDLEARRDLWVNRSSIERKADGTRFARPELETGYEAPRNEIESTMAEIWQELLGIEQIGIHDNFFDLGGQSLLATRIMSRLREALDVELQLERLFETPTVAGLAQQIETVRWARKATAAAASVAPDESEEGEL
jgi:acyl carrier protein